MSTQEEKNYNIVISMIEKATKLPMVKVNREEYLVDLFKPRNEVDKRELLEKGPHKLYDMDVLKKAAYQEVAALTRRTTLISAGTGLGSNPALAVGLGSVDVLQYYGNLINMLQKISYIFGQGDFFSLDNKISDENKEKIMLYLGVMFGVSVTGGAFAKLSRPIGISLGKRITKAALTKTNWYPALQKALLLVLSKRISKDTVGRTVTKGVPILGSVVSGAMTYATFKPMGRKLVDKFVESADEIFEEDEVIINL